MTDNDSAFEGLLESLRDERGFDFTSYRRPSLMRRFEKRLQAVGAKNYDEYREYLETHPEEYSELFNTVLINVTGFFRDKEAWDLMAERGDPEGPGGHGRQGPGAGVVGRVRDRRGALHGRDAALRGARR